MQSRYKTNHKVEQDDKLPPSDVEQFKNEVVFIFKLRLGLYIHFGINKGMHVDIAHTYFCGMLVLEAFQLFI